MLLRFSLKIRDIPFCFLVGGGGCFLFQKFKTRLVSGIYACLTAVKLTSVSLSKHASDQHSSKF